MPHGRANWRIAFMAMVVLIASCGGAAAKPALTVVVTVVNRDTDKPMPNAELSLYKYRCFFVCWPWLYCHWCSSCAGASLSMNWHSEQRPPTKD